jgi:hypothetical protein
MVEQLFFQLMQVSVGRRDRLDCVPSDEQWDELYALSKKQSVAGVCCVGVQRLPAEQRPYRRLLVRWYTLSQKIKTRNDNTSEVARMLSRAIEKDGFDTCVMKGQSNYIYYPQEMQGMRSCGDIDLWLRPKQPTRHPVKAIIDYLERKEAIVSLCYLHAEVKSVRKVPVELHFRPSFINEPRHNRRFQRIFRDMRECVEPSETLGFNVMKTEYNLLFQLNHIFRHLIDEGVGLRQLIDFYFLLQSSETQRFLAGEEMERKLRYLGMRRFAGALMWVLQEVLLLGREQMLCPPNERDGRFLLDEVMLAGNFGHHDPRLQELEVRRGKTSYQLRHAWRRFRRNLRFLGTYPSEVVCEPLARVVHFWWRKFRWWRF